MEVADFKGAQRSALRMRMLVSAIEQELGGAPGWQREAAKRLGVSDASITRIRDGTRGAGRKMVDDVCEALGLDPKWFFDRELRSTDWRDYLVGASSPDDPDNGEVLPVVLAFLATHPKAKRMQPEEIAELRGLKFGTVEPDVEMVAVVAQRMMDRRDKTEAALPAIPENKARISSKK